MTDPNDVSDPHLSIAGLFLAGAAAVALLLGPRCVQAQFPQQVIVRSTANGPTDVDSADVDGDGDLDLISASEDDDKVAWYENQVGEGGADSDGFGAQQVITSDAEDAKSIAVGDVDGDGDPDVLSASGTLTSGKIAWYENQVGESGADEDGFGAQQVITADAEDARSVAVGDVDGDGDPDVLSGLLNENKIVWYENQVGESGANEDGFGLQQVITTDAGNVRSVTVGDIDGDGDPDVFSASSNDNKIAWYENKVGESGADEDGFGPQQVITTDASTAQSVAVGDVDGDGDPDVFSASLTFGKIAWYENQVGESGADEDGFGPQQEITISAANARSVAVGDLDGDGDPDALSASEDDDKIAWYENRVGESGADEDGFGPQEEITTSAASAQSVAVGDLDGDGDPDAISASSADEIAWYENQVGESGADADGFGPQQEITTSAASAQSVAVADVDGDGDPDALSASFGDDKIAWYENQVGESGADGDEFGDQQEITTDADGARSVAAGDIDGDGDPDVLSASGSLDDANIAWYENQMGESGADGDEFGDQQVITTDADRAASVTVADVDGDGDPDVLSASSGDDKIAWYENKMGESGADSDGFGAQQVITPFASGAESVLAADLDGDGDPDVLAGDGGEIVWYENQVGESGADSDGFGNQQEITTDASGAESVSVGDLDGDGDLDVLTALFRKIAWYENQVGESGANEDGFGEQQVITTDAADPQSVSVGDLDGDGDPDALSALGADEFASDDNKIVWYENQVGESGADADGFGSEQAITTNVADPQSVLTANVDGDENPDPLSASSGDDKIAWYRNDLASILAKQSATVDDDGEVDFGDTGVDINFSGVGFDSGEVTVTKFDVGPTDMEGISEGTVSTYRFSISAGGDLEFDPDTEVQLDVSTLAGVGDASNVTVYKRPNEGTGEFTALSTSFDSGNNELVATTGSFSEFVLASDDADNPLPVEMAGFEATTDGDEVQLTWQTASETNNAGFEVQRRAAGTDGAGWTEVGFVDSKAAGGTTNEALSYRFTDEDLPFAADRLAYRLRQVDTDGTATLTDPVTVERTVEALQLKKTFPNPARNQATVRFAVPGRQEMTLRMYDVLGRKVRTVQQGEAQGHEELQVDLAGLASGTYFLQLRAEDETQTQRLTVVR